MVSAADCRLGAAGVSSEAIDKRQIAASFSRAAGTYDQVAELQRSVGNNLLARLPDPPFQSQLADIGCGTGFFTRALAERFGRPVLGLDIAEGMLRYARDRSPDSLDWVAADAENLPLRSASQDLLFSSLALQWCPHLPQALAEAFRVLRPGGCMAFNTLVEGTLGELRDAWLAVDGFVHVNRFMPLTQLQLMLAQAGFARWHCEVESHVLHYGQLSELTHELKALGAHNLNAGRPSGLTGRARLRGLTAAYEVQRQAAGLPATYQVAQVLLFKGLDQV
ncbi:malonyl-CoA O-methyltransferase [Halopseudomonas sabulinigri]|uniref:Malonyl-[acyl-carrier protein] O-methyltransferase n=1 Tax=Halopseudomonas sabulinigri TaxID=472181 RepID=A0A1H1WIZ8_9GAMM|nr:malonyl-CoA O-methyltransferase [Halopseudomonas sabulinigri]